ncbi:anti-sigma factor domain-containing protein [Rhabdothermincola salaria]|uniref:anti-sigma factor domain-containing protein n=1 Tax=Rhabdothermincola salaria TaxID=2903142 RepID=UPI001E5F5D8B|nr:anti-sigma factor [Rhabdothermincola salaria]MCD9624521.1 anti-sigma factor [Rhabdothermincola salaria]
MTPDIPRSSDDGSADEIDDLLGAYALDALDADERAAVEARLAHDPDARREADRLTHAIDELTAAQAVEPPPALWDQIAASLPPRDTAPEVTTTPEDPPATPTVASTPTGSDAVAPPAAPTGTPAPLAADRTDELAQRRARRAGASPTTTRVLAAVAGVAAAVALVLGIVVVRDEGSGNGDLAQRLTAAAERAAEEPGSRRGVLEGADGAEIEVVVDPDGRAFVLGDDLPALADDRTYQLWSVDGATPVSLGLLGANPQVAVVAAGSSRQLAISEEPVGGSTAPSSTPIASGSLA